MQSVKYRSVPRAQIIAAATLLLVFALLGFAASAQAAFPGLNGKIAYAEDNTPLPPAEENPSGTETANACGYSEDRPQRNDDDCGFNIWTMDPSGANKLQLTGLPGKWDPENISKEDKPAWSPDGTKIAFESRRECNDFEPEPEPGDASAAATEQCHSEIYVMDADGSNVRRLTRNEASDTHPTWSPDGTRIAFESDRPLDSEPEDCDVNGPRYIWVLPANADASSTDPLPSLASDPGICGFDQYPSWSPNGDKLAWTHIDLGATGDVGGFPTPISTSTDSDLDFVELLSDIRSDVSSQQEIPVVTLTITNVTRSVDQSTGAASGAVTPLINDGVECLLINPILIGVDTKCRFDTHPTWSPNGSTIAFQRNNLRFPGDLLTGGGDLGDVGIETDIWSVRANGAAETRLTNNGPTRCVGGNSAIDGGAVFLADAPPICASDGKPAWSPDGTRIAFHSDRGCNATAEGDGDADKCDLEMFTMDASDGGNISPELTSNAITDRNADWQRLFPPPPANQAQAPTPDPVVVPGPKPTVKVSRPTVRVAGVSGGCSRSVFPVRVRADGKGSTPTVTVYLNGRKLKSARTTSMRLKIRGRQGLNRIKVVVKAAGGTTSRTLRFVRCAQATLPAFTG